VTFPTAQLDAPAPSQDLTGRPWWHALGVFDLETTGVDVETARIVTAHVGLIDMTGASIVEGAWIADPGVPIPEGAAAVHGYTTERAQAEGRPAAEVVAEIIAAIEAVFARGIPLVIYNAPYDLTVLDREAKRHGFASPVIGNVVDPLVIDKALDTFRKGKRPGHRGQVPGRARDLRRRTPPQAGRMVRRAGRLVPGLHAQEARPDVHRRRPLAPPQRRLTPPCPTGHRCSRAEHPQTAV